MHKPRSPATQPPRSGAQPPFWGGGRAPQPLQEKTPHRMNLGVDDILAEPLHRRLGWDMRHHFMAEKIIDRFCLELPRDRELIRQLAVAYVRAGMKQPPEKEQYT